jgi:hypothetical protein
LNICRENLKKLGKAHQKDLCQNRIKRGIAAKAGSGPPHKSELGEDKKGLRRGWEDRLFLLPQSISNHFWFPRSP